MTTKPLPKPHNRRAKYDWNEITIQFLTSDHAEFASFCADMGYPKGLCKSPNASRIAERKRSVMASQAEKVRQALLAEPMRQREERKFEVLKELEQAGRALHASVMNDIRKDLYLTGQRRDEKLEDWIERTRNVEYLTPGEKMALGVALKHADELVRKAAGLEDFDWENAERNAKAIAKSNRLEFEIVKTSNATPIDQLPRADEDAQEVG